MEHDQNKIQSNRKVLNRLSVPNVTLVGGTASGKSTVGYQLARILDFGVVDLDEMIEKVAGKSIGELFKENGEQGFRTIESDVIQMIKGIRNHVIVTGGGAIESEENWKVLKGLGPVIWLATPTTEIVRRMLNKPSEIEKRPLLGDALFIEDKEERAKFLQGKLDEMMARRQERFDQADYTLSCSYVTVDTCAQFIKSMLIRGNGDDERSERH